METVAIAAAVMGLAWLAVSNARKLAGTQDLEVPWQLVGVPRAHETYLALITRYPVSRSGRLSKFLTYTRIIKAQLNQAEGLIGYSLRANFIRPTFMTLSVWESEDALGAFTADTVHREAMDELKMHLGEARVVRWPIEGSKTPPSWEEAFDRLESN